MSAKQLGLNLPHIQRQSGGKTQPYELSVTRVCDLALIFDQIHRQISSLWYKTNRAILPWSTLLQTAWK